MQYWRKIKFPQIHFPTGPLKLALRLSCLLKTQKRTHPRIRFSFTWNIWGITLLWRNKIEFKYQCGTSGIVISTFYFLFVFQWFCLSFLLSFCSILLVLLLGISGLQSVFSQQGILLTEKGRSLCFSTQNAKHRILPTEGCKSLDWSSCQQEMIFFVRLENLMGCHLFYGDHSLQQSSNLEIKWCGIERTAEKNAHTPFVNINL